MNIVKKLANGDVAQVTQSTSPPFDGSDVDSSAVIRQIGSITANEQTTRMMIASSGPTDWTSGSAPYAPPTTEMKRMPKSLIVPSALFGDVSTTSVSTMECVSMIGAFSI